MVLGTKNLENTAPLVKFTPKLKSKTNSSTSNSNRISTFSNASISNKGLTNINRSTYNSSTNATKPTTSSRALTVFKSASYSGNSIAKKSLTSSRASISSNASSTRSNRLARGQSNKTLASQYAHRTENLAAFYTNKVNDAFRNRKIFVMRNFNFYEDIRKILLSRGWIEKSNPEKFLKFNELSDRVLLANAEPGNEFEKAYLNRLILRNNYPPFLLWQRCPYFLGQAPHDPSVLPLTNTIRRNVEFDYKHKAGLIACSELAKRWFQTLKIIHPRVYGCKGREERTEFIKDFRRTQCRSLIRYIVENISMPNKLLDAKNGTIDPGELIPLARENMERQLKDWVFHSVDQPNEADPTNAEWAEFLRKSSSIISEKCKFRATFEELNEFVTIAREYLNRIEERRPDFKWDGFRNLWIIKPGYQNPSKNIAIKNMLSDILAWTTKHADTKCIIQKYIERPLLIYDCKFDIRLFSLLTMGETTSSLWHFKDGFIKFSTQPFTLDNLDESIHITNVSVQKKYSVGAKRNPILPKNNLWSLKQLQNYLIQTAPKNVWSNKIDPGIKEIMTSVITAGLEKSEIVENAFEVYGVDFMLDEEYNPILIEINCYPLYSLQGLIPTLAGDILKVLLDFPHNPNASTGLFEMILKIDNKTLQKCDIEDGLNAGRKSISDEAFIMQQVEEKIDADKIYKNIENSKEGSNICDKTTNIEAEKLYTNIENIDIKNSITIATIEAEQISKNIENIEMENGSISCGEIVTKDQDKGTTELDKISKMQYYKKLLAKRQVTKFLYYLKVLHN